MALRIKDRTDEFFNTVSAISNSRNVAAASARIQQQNAPVAGGASSLGPNGVKLTANEFSRAAAEIARGIHDTTAKHAELTQLAKRKALYNDQTAKIQELTVVIKRNINRLNGEIEQLQSHVQSKLRAPNQQTNVHSDTVVATLKTKLAMTTKEFSEVLQVRTETLKAQEDRRQMYTSTNSLKTTPDSYVKQRQHARTSQSLLRDESTSTTSPSSAQGAATPLLAGGGQQQRQSQLQLRQHDTYLESQAEAVKSVESTIVELGQIYQKLATIVSMQDELCLRIDQNMDSALADVNKGHSYLLKTWNNVSQDRWLIIKIFLVLLFFIVLFVVFVA